MTFLELLINKKVVYTSQPVKYELKTDKKKIKRGSENGKTINV